MEDLNHLNLPFHQFIDFNANIMIYFEKDVVFDDSLTRYN